MKVIAENMKGGKYSTNDLGADGPRQMDGQEVRSETPVRAQAAGGGPIALREDDEVMSKSREWPRQCVCACVRAPRSVYDCVHLSAWQLCPVT